MKEKGPDFYQETIRDRGLEDYQKALGVDLVNLIDQLGGEKRTEAPSLLDVGCGNGKMLSELLNLRPDIRAIGLDSNRYPEQYSGYIEYATIEDFNPSEKFDLIISVKVFHYFPDKIKDLVKIYSLLKPGGLAVINLPSDLIRLNEQIGQLWSSNKPEDERFGTILERLGKVCPGVTYEYPDTDSSGLGYSVRSDSGRFVIHKPEGTQEVPEGSVEFVGTSEVDNYLVSYYKDR